MENIDDIRREEGNPRAQQPAGAPRSIAQFFPPGKGVRMVAMLLVALGCVILLIGAVSFIMPLALVGLAVILVAGLGYIWARPNQA